MDTQEIRKIVTRNTRITFKIVRMSFFYTTLFCLIFAISRATTTSSGFLESLIIIECMGIGIWACILMALFLVKVNHTLTLLLLLIIASTIGSITGIFSGNALAGAHLNYIEIQSSAITGIIFGSIISYVSLLWVLFTDSMTVISEERVKLLQSEKRALESNLKFLQAQIEPHFLFNTMFNILSLLDSDVGKGKNMLEDLIRYLRTSLSKAREGATTIGQEIDLIRAYLNIFKVRMEDRLNYTIDVPERIRDFPFPPMLLQPLVENAIKHGLEPMINGGEISVCCHDEDGIIRVQISDNGLGFQEVKSPGMGLANIRERLRSLYNDKGLLVLEANNPSGVTATIEIPCDQDTLPMAPGGDSKLPDSAMELL